MEHDEIFNKNKEDDDTILQDDKWVINEMSSNKSNIKEQD